MKRKNYYIIGVEATIFEEISRICVKHHLNAAIRKAKKLYCKSDKYLDITVVDSNGKILYSSFSDMATLGCSYDDLSTSEFKSLYLSKREIVDPYKISNNHECNSDLPKELDWYTNILSSAERGDYTFISGDTVFIDQMIQYASRRKAKIGSFKSFKLDDIGEKEAGVHKLDYHHITDKEYLQATCNHRTPDGQSSLVYDNETGVARCIICGYEFKPIDPDTSYSLREEEN